MDELVIPAAKAGSIFRVVVSTPFALGGAAMVVGGGYALVKGHWTVGLLVPVALLCGLGLLTATMFGVVAVQAVQTLMSRGLRLTAEGFALNDHLHPWADVKEFVAVGGTEVGVTHVRVAYVEEAQRRWGTRTTAALGKVGYYAAPAYLPIAEFDSGGAALLDIMRRWHQGDRSAGKPGRQPPNPVVPTRASDAEQLVIRLKLSERIAPLIGSIAFFVILAFGLPWVLVDNHDSATWTMIALGVLWLLLTGVMGWAVLWSVQEFRSPGLVLDSNGFRYGKHEWAWADIEDVHTVLRRSSEGSSTGFRVQYRVNPSIRSAPADLPFGPNGFTTGGQAVHEVLREYLRRQRARENDAGL